MSNERVIIKKVEIACTISEAWKAWTTKKGITSFFAPDCHIEIRPDGPYEIFFMPEAPVGERGAEDMRVLAEQSEKMLSFTWNSPPQLSTVRNQRTHVVVRFNEISRERTEVILRHDGWGEGDEWDDAYDYFENAWGNIVLPRLKYSFDVGPVDWNHPPALDGIRDE